MGEGGGGSCGECAAAAASGAAELVAAAASGAGEDEVLSPADAVLPPEALMTFAFGMVEVLVQ